MFESVLRSKKAIVDLATRAKHDELTPSICLKGGGGIASIDKCDVDISLLIDDPLFWKRLEEADILMKPIAALVTYLESDTAPISMFAGAFIKLFRTYKKLSLHDGLGFPFQSLGLTKEIFQDTGVHTNKTFPDMLRRVWNELTSNTVNPTRPELFSALAQLAVFLDEGTKSLFVLAQQQGICLDPLRSIAAAAIEGSEYLAELFLDDPRHKGRHPLFQRYSLEVANEIESLVRQGGGFKPPVEKRMMFHPLRQIQFQYSPAAMVSSILFVLSTSAAGGERSFTPRNVIVCQQRNLINWFS